MENKLTNEEIARVLGLYMGSSFIEMKLVGKLYPAKILDILRAQSDAKLYLTPLSSITDEHAIEVAKCFYNLCFNGNCKTGWVVKRDEIYPQEFLNISHKDNDYSFNMDLIDGNLTLYRMGEYDSGGSHVNTVDKLRELQYALPYKNKSLFELNIAIDKTKQP